ncbi:MAG: bifunctional DNA-formamidopyrimidine glycosylase/DNA-(apurinic or apyrimidinic site) lyase [Leptospirillia bacterium]
MPELPEVETTRRGVAPHVRGRRIDNLIVRDPRLRWPVPDGLPERVAGRTVAEVSRRAKYLLLRLEQGGVPDGSLILHLGMSGSLRVVGSGTPPGRHDAFDLVLEGSIRLRLNDPRRFGCLLFTEGNPAAHRLLAHLGPEPLGDGFDGAYLHAAARGRTAPVKHFIMDGRTVVGVGNIYASEALHRAGIHPGRAAGRISKKRCDRLAGAIKGVLGQAIEAGGTTLRDFTGSDGKPGYFQQRLAVYGRAGEPCPTCGDAVRQLPLGQRSTFYCPSCQH